MKQPHALEKNSGNTETTKAPALQAQAVVSPLHRPLHLPRLVYGGFRVSGLGPEVLVIFVLLVLDAGRDMARGRTHFLLTSAQPKLYTSTRLAVHNALRYCYVELDVYSVVLHQPGPQFNRNTLKDLPWDTHHCLKTHKWPFGSAAQIWGLGCRKMFIFDQK